MNSVLAKDTGDTFVTSGDVKIPTVTIDDLADNFGHPNIIKMDIQGFEADRNSWREENDTKRWIEFFNRIPPKIGKKIIKRS